MIDARINSQANKLAACEVLAAQFLARRRARHGTATMDATGIGALLERSTQERDQVVGLIDGVTRAAFEGNRDLSEQDHDTINRARERLTFLDNQIDRLSFDTQLSDRARQALATNGATGAAPQLMYRSAGEALHDLLHYSNPESRQRLDTAMHRAAQHMGTDAAATVAVAGGLGALVVRPVVGPVIDTTPRGRPFLDALGVIQLDTPNGFSRPRIVDNAYGTAPATQTAQKAELVSRAFDVKLDAIDSETIGEYLNVSQKLLSWPVAALNMILAQFQKRRAWKLEARAVAEVLTSGTTVDLDLAPAAADEPRLVHEAFWEAARLVFANTGELPRWTVTGPLGWVRLGSMLATDDRPLFPAVGMGSQGALGSASADTFVTRGPAGLPTIVTHAITGPEFVVGNELAMEAYEYAYPMLEAVEPSVLGRQIAVASELALYRPSTDEPGTPGDNGEGNGAVIVRPPVGP